MLPLLLLPSLLPHQVLVTAEVRGVVRAHTYPDAKPLNAFKVATGEGGGGPRGEGRGQGFITAGAGARRQACNFSRQADICQAVRWYSTLVQGTLVQGEQW